MANSAVSSIVLPFWFDRPPSEAIEIARRADASGCRELWIGEMATFDAFALAGAIARETRRIHLTIGPLPAATRSPVALAMGIASVAELAQRPVGLALGASNPAIVSGWHEREWRAPVRRMREQLQVLRRLFAGERVTFSGRATKVQSFKLRMVPPPVTISLAAFAPAMLRLAATEADRVVVNLITAAQLARLRRDIDAAAQSAGKGRPKLVAWVPAALARSAGTLRQLAQQLAAYLPAPGYGEMFGDAGFGAIVEQARSGLPRVELARSLPIELIERVAAIGDPQHLHDRLDDWYAAGADQVAVVPATSDDPGGERLIEALSGAPRRTH